MDDTNIGMKSYEFIFLFNKTSGSPRVQYFMVDPWTKTRIFPKCNSIVFNKLTHLVGFRPVVLDGCLYIIGGKDWESGQYRAQTWRYDPATSRWSGRASMLEARCRHTADVLNGCIYVTGGEIHGGGVTDLCESYDPVLNSWTAINCLPRPRADHAACVNDGSLYVSGGISNLKHQCSNVFWVYDAVANEWDEPIQGIILPHEREKHNMVSVGKYIYVVSGRGFDQETWSEKDESAICCFNTRSKGETRKDTCWDVYHPNVFNPRANAGVILLGQQLYFIGGKSFQKDCDVRTVECYNVKRRKLREAFTLPEGYSYVNVDCVKLSVPVSNTDITFNDLLLYDKWIMW
ncbi:kelch-like protein 13 [Ylistrum balloti]|uniref:kelch-like protein 13 n=1 Tax=Ylistrum balloti TaxID=509963 RepID=UPI002905B1D7|nr:kelch-like protein 13 [Ylistrum balloti]